MVIMILEIFTEVGHYLGVGWKGGGGVDVYVVLLLVTEGYVFVLGINICILIPQKQIIMTRIMQVL